MASSTVINGVSIYALSAGKTMPQWLSERRKRALKKDDAFVRRIELIQDFGFPVASQTVVMAPDGRHIITTGTYPPRVRVYDTAELSLKFERYMDATPVASAVLGDDYGKLAFLQDDRHVEVHAAYGKHYRTRIPKFGRAMLYHAPTAELLIAASDAEVYRLNLEAGRFMAPLALPPGAPAANKLAVSRVTALIAAACDGGTVECYDPRSHARAASVAMPLAAGGGGGGCDVTSVAWDDGGLGLAAGTSDGRALLFDVRRATPLHIKHHQYGLPVIDVKFHRGSGGTGRSGGGGGPGGADASGGGSTSGDLVLSADAKSVKLWRRSDGATWTNIEAPATIRDVAIASDAPGSVGAADSGLIMMAGDTERVMAFYLPQLGLAPRWCSFLDGLTEELEEGGAAGAPGGSAGGGGLGVYDDYRFVTRDELSALGLGHLVGTPLLKAYMHGYFMDSKLYARVQAVADPDAYDRWKRSRVRAALDEARGSRIVLEDPLPKVNKDLAKRLIADAARRKGLKAAAAAAAGEGEVENNDDEGGSGALGSAGAGVGGKRKRAAGGAEAVASRDPAATGGSGSLLTDSRFSRLFSDPEFAIDADSAEYLQLHPATAAAATRSDGAAKRRRQGRAAEDSDDGGSVDGDR
jgi:ribosome biogenesis protein ENP2